MNFKPYVMIYTPSKMHKFITDSLFLYNAVDIKNQLRYYRGNNLIVTSSFADEVEERYLRTMEKPRKQRSHGRGNVAEVYDGLTIMCWACSEQLPDCPYGQPRS